MFYVKMHFMNNTLITCPKCGYKFLVSLENYVDLNEMADFNRIKWQCPSCKHMILYNRKNVIPYYNGQHPSTIHNDR